MNLNRKYAVAFFSLTIQLGLVLLALWRFGIEESYGLPRLLPLIFIGFIVHSLLPPRYRRPFFLALSFAAIAVILPFPYSLLLVGIGLGLVGICHLPISFRARVGLIVFVAATLASVRAGWVDGLGLGEFPSIVLPVLGAMFMFRLAIYLYDLRHEQKPATLSERLSYFFLLPNVCFLLFPVVDYQTYRRTYYNEDENAIYQKGLLWMVRGLTHLLLYRLVYQYLVPSAADVHNLATVVQFSVTSYLLYLRISGQFHLIIGILCLFGFNLPETHHRYFLASGFTDFWRRINIYWKDFMLKMIYYPIFVPMRSFAGMTAGMVFATVVVFIGTWLLHSYQWLWLRGSFPITATDGIFWGLLGAMVVVSSLKEARTKKREAQALNFRIASTRSAKTAGFFVFMCLLWSFWSSSTPGEWVATVAKAGSSGIAEFGLLAAALAAMVIVGALIQMSLDKRSPEPAVRRPWLTARPALYVTGLASMFIVLSLPYARIVLGGDSHQLVTSLRQERLNIRDQEVVDRGYYEGLLDHGHFTSALWSARMGDPNDPEAVPIMESAIADKRDDLLEYELKTTFSGTFKDAPFVTNRWRMRGPEYDQAKPPDTYRIALVGASYEMAGGVNNSEAFPAILEETLNKRTDAGSYSRFEVLNFSVAGYSMIHKAIVAENGFVPFKPDLVVVTVYSTEEVRLLGHLARVVENEIPIPYPDLREVVDRSGARPWMPHPQIRSRLEPYLYDVIEWSFRKLKADCQERGLPLVLLFLPATTDRRDENVQYLLGRLRKRASNAGLELFALERVYDGYEMSQLQLSMWDSHLNVLGNRLMAQALFDFFEEYETQILPAEMDRAETRTHLHE